MNVPNKSALHRLAGPVAKDVFVDRQPLTRDGATSRPHVRRPRTSEPNSVERNGFAVAS